MFNNSELEFILDALDHEENLLTDDLDERRSPRMKKVKRLQAKIENLLSGKAYREQSICYYCFAEMVAEEPPEAITLVKFERKPEVGADR